MGHVIPFFILAVLTTLAQAQEVLPFPTSPMGGKVGPTMQESVHKWREQARHLPEDAPNILIVMLDDAGFGQPNAFGGEIETPDDVAVGEGGYFLQRLPHHRDVLAHPGCPDDRPQP